MIKSIILMILYWIISYTLYSIVFLQALLSVTVSIKCLKISRRNLLMADYGKIKSRIRFTIITCTFIYAIAVFLILSVPFRNMYGFSVGTIIAFMSSLKELGLNKNNISDYVNVYGSDYQDPKELVYITLINYAKYANMQDSQREHMQTDLYKYNMEFKERFGSLKHPYTGKPVSSVQEYIDAIDSQTYGKCILTERVLSLNEIDQIFKERFKGCTTHHIDGVATYLIALDDQNKSKEADDMDFLK